MKNATHEQLVEIIRKRSLESTQFTVAVELDTTQQHISEILRGTRRIGPALAYQMGYTPVVTYRKIEVQK